MITVPLKGILPDKTALKRKLHAKRTSEEKLIDSLYEEAMFCFDPKYTGRKVSFLAPPISSLIGLSSGLEAAMDGAEEGFVVICTIGEKYTSLMEKYGLHLDRLASDTVENLAEHSARALLEQYFNEEEWTLTKRYSPGYGDLGLDAQKHIFSLFRDETLDVMLTESFYMEPEKSISYIVGVKKK